MSKYDPKIMVQWFAEHGLTATPEFRFDPKRKWRFDFVFLSHKIALEVEGGVFTGGRHTRGSGFMKDMEKYNRAAVLGWRVLRCVPKELCMQETVDLVKAAIGQCPDSELYRDTGADIDALEGDVGVK